MEIEAKYALKDASDISLVLQSEFWNRYAQSSLISEPFCAVYWDTPDGRVAGQRSSIRLRREGPRAILTLKWPIAHELISESAITARGEFNLDLSEDEMERWKACLLKNAELNELVPVELRETSLVADLCSRYKAKFIRHHRLLSFQDALIELAIDQGHLSVVGGKEDLSELELELLSGDASSLYALCALVEKEFGLKKLDLSKFSRLLALEKRMSIS